MTVGFRNNTFTNCGVAMVISGEFDVDIDSNIITDCGYGVVFESELDVNSRIRNNSITGCGDGIFVGDTGKGRVSMRQAARNDFMLSPVTILVRGYLLSLVT